MIHASALRALLAENCEEPISCMILCSPTGSIIGTSSTLPSILISKLAVLSALTWRTHMDVSPRITATEPLPVTSTKKSPSSGSTSDGTVIFSRYEAYELSIQLVLRDILLIVIAEKSTAAKPIPIAQPGQNGVQRAEMGIDDVDTEEALAHEQLRGDPTQNQELLGSSSPTNAHINGDETMTDEDVHDIHKISPATNSKNDLSADQLHEALVRKGAAMAEYLRSELKGFRMPELSERA